MPWWPARAPASWPSLRTLSTYPTLVTAYYTKVPEPDNTDQQVAFGRPTKLSAEAVSATGLPAEPISAKLTAVPGNGTPLGGLKVTTDNA